MVSGKIVIKDGLGIHLRPASLIAEEALKYACKVELCYNDRRVNGKSLLSILSLGIRKGNELEVCCDGADEEAALTAVMDVISHADDLAARSST